MFRVVGHPSAPMSRHHLSKGRRAGIRGTEWYSVAVCGGPLALLIGRDLACARAAVYFISDQTSRFFRADAWYYLFNRGEV